MDQNQNPQNDQNRVENGYYYTAPNNGQTPYDSGMYAINEKPQTTGLATTSLVLGIIGILFSCCCGVGGIFGVVALILAIVDRSHLKRFSGVAIGGLVCAIIAILISIGIFVVMEIGGEFVENNVDLFESILNSMLIEEGEDTIIIPRG